MFVPYLVMRPEIYDFEKNTKYDASYFLITRPFFGVKKNGKKLFCNRDEYEIIATDGMVFLLQRIQK